MKQDSFLRLFIALLFVSIVFTAGCERKTDDTDQPAADTIRTDTTNQIDTTGTDTTGTINLQGTWRGTLNQRSSTFTISEFKDNRIKGTITTQSRETSTQQVEGTFRPESRNVSLKDLTHSRFMGEYTGTISEDGTTLSGTFKSNADGSTAKFSYKKEK